MTNTGREAVMKRRLMLAGPLLLALTACGGGTSPSPAPPPPPPPAPPAAVATVTVEPGSASLLPGATVQLAATPKDAGGAALSGRTVTWTSSDPAVATVSAAGVVTGATPGTATVTATSEGKTGTAAVTIVDPARMPSFVKPFTEPADLRTTNYFDHDIPKEFVDANGVYRSSWGENSLMGIDGHNGYDWRLPTGTPIVAAMAGTVIGFTPQPFFCPITNTTVTDNGLVVVEHTLPGGVTLRTQYLHLSRIDVAPNQVVQAGQQLGLSGGTGCAANPHLHFGVVRLTQTKSGAPAIIDPYGWDGAGADPWEQAADGAASIYLWKNNEAPSRFRITTLNADPGLAPASGLGLTQVRFQGPRDDLNPNNEYVEIGINPAITAQADLTGFTLRDKAGAQYALPAGIVLTAARPTIRVFTGTGTNGSAAVFLGKPAGIWNNGADCVQLFNGSGVRQYRLFWGAACP